MVEAMLMYWTQKNEKKVYYLNDMLSVDPYTQRNKKTIECIQKVFEKCEVISVRENFSYKYAEQNFKNINMKLYPDALFLWYKYIKDDFNVLDGKYFIGKNGANDESFYQFDFSKPYICVSGSSSIVLASKTKEETVNVYKKLV